MTLRHLLVRMLQAQAAADRVFSYVLYPVICVLSSSLYAQLFSLLFQPHPKLVTAVAHPRAWFCC